MFENAQKTTPQSTSAAFVTTPTVPAISAKDKAAIELFERAKLTKIQKIILFCGTFFVLVLVAGVGIWLSLYLPTLVKTTGANNQSLTNLGKANNGNFNSKPKDSDSDGLSDVDEQQKYRTNPNSRDTDGDGYPDDEEVRNGYDPNGPGRLNQ